MSTLTKNKHRKAIVLPERKSSPQAGYDREAKVPRKYGTTMGAQGNTRERSSLGKCSVQGTLDSGSATFKPRVLSPS